MSVSDTAAVKSKKDASLEANGQRSELVTLGVDQLVRGRYQPRVAFDIDSLEEMAGSIAAKGVIEPIVARPLPNGKYEILAGERRWRAAQMALLHEVPVVLRPCEDDEALEISLIENVIREPLTPIEEARALFRLNEEFGKTHQEIAEVTGRSRSSVSHMIRLLSLEPTTQDLLHRGKLELGHAKVLLGLKPEIRQLLVRETVKSGLTVRQLEKRAAVWEGAAKKKTSRAVDPDIKRLEEKFGALIGCPCEVSFTKSGSGELTIRFTALDVLQGVLERFGASVGCNMEVKANPNGSGSMGIKFPNLDKLQKLLEKAGYSEE